MKNLIKKELTLCTNPQVIIFCLLSALVVIPEWPSMIGMVYVLSGLSTIFPRALADQDIQYTTMLPLRKGDVVKGKTFLVAILEIGSLLFSIPFSLLKCFLIDPPLLADYSAHGQEAYYYTLGVQPSLGGYGYVLIAFGVFNFILLPWYYKNPQKVNWPPVISFFAAIGVLGIGIALEYMTVSYLSFNKSTLLYWLIEGCVALAGVLIYVGLTFFAEKKAEKKFDKVDL